MNFLRLVQEKNADTGLKPNKNEAKTQAVENYVSFKKIKIYYLTLLLLLFYWKWL